MRGTHGSKRQVSVVNEDARQSLLLSRLADGPSTGEKIVPILQTASSHLSLVSHQRPGSESSLVEEGGMHLLLAVKEVVLDVPHDRVLAVVGDAHLGPLAQSREIRLERARARVRD